ncbi:hypothetical protein [Prauserella cavernicola]|nr:hypothetical protein [Prauserella cavernicola]
MIRTLLSVLTRWTSLITGPARASDGDPPRKKPRDHKPKGPASR